MIIEKFIFGKHLEEGEKILYSVHKHWIEIGKLFGEGILNKNYECHDNKQYDFHFCFFIFVFILFLFPWGLYAIGFNTDLFFWVAIIWSSFAYVRFFYILIDWYCDAWLSTNMGIIAVEWKGVFSNSATRIGYEDVEGVGYEINGFWPTILRYGHLTLKVNSGNNLSVIRAASPKEAELELARLQAKFLSNKSMQDSDGLKSLLAKYFSSLIPSLS